MLSMAIKRRFHSIPMPNLKTISEKTTKKHLFEVLPCQPSEPLHNAGWALKGYTHYFVFKAYQCHITIATKLTIPPCTKDFYFSKYTPICPWQSTVILSYSRSNSHTVVHTVIRSFRRSCCRSYSHTVCHTVIQ